VAGMAWSFEFKVVCFLVLLVFLSGVGVAYSKFWVRTQTALLYQLQKEGDIAQAEWSQLLVEQNSWASMARIEKMAVEQGMLLPSSKETIVIRRTGSL